MGERNNNTNLIDLLIEPSLLPQAPHLRVFFKMGEIFGAAESRDLMFILLH
jgi:hypothetical protein